MADIEILTFPIVTCTSSEASFAFDGNEDNVEYTLDGAPYEFVEESPLVLTGLANGAHTLVMRIYGTSTTQSFSWIVAVPDTEPELESLEVPITPADPEYIDHVTLAIDRLCAQFRNPNL
jgi:hypothetical protein